MPFLSPAAVDQVDRYMKDVDAVEPSSVNRKHSLGLFGGSSFNMNDSSFGAPLRGSFSFCSSDSLWSAVNKCKEERAVANAPQALQPSHSFASNFTTMTGDELSDEIEPWTMHTDDCFDLGFSSALRDACIYHMPREFLPSDEDTDSDCDDGSDTAVDSEPNTQQEMDDGDISETETVCDDEPEPDPNRESIPQPTSPVPDSSEFLASPSLPDAWTPATPVHITTSFPRRSARVSRPTRVLGADREKPQTPIKRKRPSPPNARPSPSKKVHFVETKTPIARSRTARTTRSRPSPPPSRNEKAGSPRNQEPTLKIRRVILRV
ncbi:hypothetical protein B0H17DRAFT_1254475 [Mycena rosella]|uniref:Uncharacterized protein n=1 Tax=Mycena rosella TaxID=1033263 RepID=A0AAD7G709_MYCRO|nr:hypothetical protein B0H17DRAFT_1254475 [Mycena rosella]